MRTILDDPRAMEAIRLAGYGVMILSPAEGATPDDERIERIVIRMLEALKEIGEDEGATYADLVCATLELTARIIASPFALQQGKRFDHRRVADEMSKNLRRRILGACRNEGAGQERPEN